MNERIQELMPKPWTFPYPDREMYSKEQLIHLAELIVRECANVDLYWLGEQDCKAIAERIKKHFGVEK